MTLLPDRGALHRSRRNPEILEQDGYPSVAVEQAEVREVLPGVRLRPLWKGPTGAHANVLEMDPGTSWPRRDVHEPGPEEVYALSGTFNDGARLPGRDVPPRARRLLARAPDHDRLQPVPLLPRGLTGVRAQVRQSVVSTCSDALDVPRAQPHGDWARA